jgi:NAD(P)-dependent dehydrogenase (short-subunit alcohol dehydrogenase family)
MASAEAHTVDLADPDATAALARALLDRHGRVDVLVNKRRTSAPTTSPTSRRRCCAGSSP